MESTSAFSQLRDRISAIEQSLDGNCYRPGPWDSVVRAARGLDREARMELAGDLSRVSRRLHQRHHWRTLNFSTALFIEFALAVTGCILLIFAVRYDSNLLVLLAAALLSVAFQPLIKVTTGLLLGVSYDYAYLYHVEPRFKMTYGKYLAAPRWARIMLHLAGTIGSPLGVWLPTVFASRHLLAAICVCWAFFWLFVLINLASFLVVLSGIYRIRGFRLLDSSGGMAALELREALEF
jgi:hypothetical protein